VEKTCSKCGLKKPISEFNKRAESWDGVQSQCKSCTRERDKKYRSRDGLGPGARARRCGLTKEEVRTFITVPCCQACGLPFTDDYSQKFDHCHDGGHFRGVLCNPCNLACAGTSKVASARLAKCIDYLLRDDERTQ
jgi:hypothetical protein